MAVIQSARRFAMFFSEGSRVSKLESSATVSADTRPSNTDVLSWSVRVNMLFDVKKCFKA